MRLSLFLLGLCPALLGCEGEAAPARQPPATLDNPVKETDLTRVRLTPEAERRIGIETSTVERRQLPRLRTVGGEVILRPGADVMITAPRAGTVLPPADGHIPVTGRKVLAGDELARFVALPAESDLLGGRQDVVIAEARLSTAKRRHERASELFKLQAVTAQELEDTEAEVLAAQAVLRSAEARLSTVANTAGDTSAMPLALNAPIDAIVTGIHVATGQRVSEGVKLMSLEGIDPIWVRVPVYAGDLRDIDPAAGAQIQGMGDPPGTGGRRAGMVTGPPSANADAATVDLYFQAPNRDGAFRAGQRVGVVLRLRQGETGLVVPWSAVVRDV
ncbi:MAG: efflux RND transporter periplasmic adaptor subunit, partial [Gemmatimonadota bacterium]|nr:efflux RND transporter periplasmic adaptor subunit [Gemmatimonadota bacterium]